MKKQRKNNHWKLLGAKGIATRSKNATSGAPGLTTSNKKLLVTTKTSADCFRPAVASISPDLCILLLKVHIGLST